jgi:hypothetical protein
MTNEKPERRAVAEGPEAKAAYSKLSPLARQILDVVFDYPTEEQLIRGKLTEGGQSAAVEMIYWLIKRIENVDREDVDKATADRFILALKECTDANFIGLNFKQPENN